MHKSIIAKMNLTPTFHFEQWGNGPKVPVFEYKDGLFVTDGRAAGLSKKTIVLFTCGKDYNPVVLLTPAMLKDFRPEQYCTIYSKDNQETALTKEQFENQLLPHLMF